MNTSPTEYCQKIETLEQDQIRKQVQLPKLLKQLKYIFDNSIFYQEKFKKAGLELGDIKTVDDIHRIPFTEKDEIRKSQLKAPPLGEHMACRWDQIKRIYTSSGTSGMPTFIGVTPHDYEDVWMTISARSHYCNGFRPGDRVVVNVNSGPFVAGSEIDAFERIGCTTIPLPPGNTERVVMAFQHGANGLLGSPSYLHYLETWCHEKGIDTGVLGLRKITLSGEPGAGIPAVREKIQSAFNAVVTETAGISDIAISILGECECQCGMHFCAQEFVIAEIIDPETGQPIEWKDGVTGELVYTAIDRECVPLVRFRTRDHVQAWVSKCDCGRTSPRIKIVGRTDDMLIIKGVNVFPSAIKAVVTEFKPKTSGAIEIHLKQPGPAIRSPLPVRVEYTSEAVNLKELKVEIEKALRNKLVFRADVELVPEGILPKSEYKTNLIKKPSS